MSKFISEYTWGNQFVLEELLAAFPNVPLLVHHSIANAHVLRRVQDFPVSYHFIEIKGNFFVPLIIKLVWYLRNNTISYYIYDVIINNIFLLQCKTKIFYVAGICTVLDER